MQAREKRKEKNDVLRLLNVPLYQLNISNQDILNYLYKLEIHPEEFLLLTMMSLKFVCTQCYPASIHDYLLTCTVSLELITMLLFVQQMYS